MLQQGSVNANNVRNLFNVEMVKLRDHFPKFYRGISNFECQTVILRFFISQRIIKS